MKLLRSGGWGVEKPVRDAIAVEVLGHRLSAHNIDQCGTALAPIRQRGAIVLQKVQVTPGDEGKTR